MASGSSYQFITHDARLASFQKSTKKRGSTASGRGKALNWPHRQIAPSRLAKAGFYFNPSPASPDNVTCFLCGKGLDGWEAGDDPVEEHVKHAQDCGWAVVAALQAELDDFPQRDPASPEMVEARKATFAGMWPHESKKGWKCKTKQLVDSGWKYTPTAESDDMATCAYCELALDGWEPGDKPYDEHFNRSPDCAFFELMKQFDGTRKKTSRSKAGRGSKASRVSAQSVVSEAASIGDTTAVGDDSIVTTSSSLGPGAKKARGRKAASATSGRSRTKQSDQAPVDDGDPHEQTVVPAKPAKSTRGKKRGSEAMSETATTSFSEAPAPKKRATRARSSTVINSSTVIADDSEADGVPGPAKKAAGAGRRKNAPSSAKTSRQVSAFSTISTASMASLRGPPAVEFPDDEEIERQLEAQLALESDEDEGEEVRQVGAGASTTGRGAATKKTSDYAMFAPADVDAHDASVEAELLALQSAMQVNQSKQPSPANKSRSTAARQSNEETKNRRVMAASPLRTVEVPELVSSGEPAADELHEAEAAENVEVLQVDTEMEAPAPAKRGRGRPSKDSLASRQSGGAQESRQPESIKQGRSRLSRTSLTSRTSDGAAQVVEPANPVPKAARGRPSKASLASRTSNGPVEPADTMAKATRSPAPTVSQKAPAIEAPEVTAAAKRPRGRPAKKSNETTAPAVPAAPLIEDQAQDVPNDVADAMGGIDAMQPEKAQQGAPRSAQQLVTSPQVATIGQQPFAAAAVISPAPSARQPAISPSPSPQSSDAENQPPSSKAPASGASYSAAKRAALTPARNVLAGLESSAPWTAVNLAAVLGDGSSSSPTSGEGQEEAGSDKENAVAVGRMLSRHGELTSPEKGMTVEEWIYFNAGEAERRLKHECETMVSRFEREGTRAMNALEGLSAE